MSDSTHCVLCHKPLWTGGADVRCLCTGTDLRHRIAELEADVAEAAEERRRYEDAESWREHPGWCRCQRVCGGDQ